MLITSFVLYLSQIVWCIISDLLHAVLMHVCCILTHQSVSQSHVLFISIAFP